MAGIDGGLDGERNKQEWETYKAHYNNVKCVWQHIYILLSLYYRSIILLLYGYEL